MFAHLCSAILLSSTLFLSSHPLFGCGDILLKGNDGTLINARSMEFAAPMDAQIVAFARGQQNQSDAPDNAKGMAWTSKYGFVGINAFGIDIALDGINEKGLSVGGLWLPTTVYQEVPQGKQGQAVAIDQFINWLLGSFATVEEVKDALGKVFVWGKLIPAIKMVPPLHFAVHDANGKSIVIEFINGEPKIYDNSVAVLTNFPTFDWHLNNLRNYTQLSPINAPPKPINGANLDFLGHGAGMLGVPGDWMPAARFIRLAIFKGFAAPGKDAAGTLNLAEHLFNTVDIPYGLVGGTDSKDIDYTQWVVFKDLTNKVLYYRTYGNMALRAVKLKDLNFNAGTTFKEIKIDTPPAIETVSL